MNDDGIDATRIHANVQPEASDVLPGIPIDTEQTNTGQIDATQIHANVQLEELPDIATIRSYTCPCQCEDDHEGRLRTPAPQYHVPRLACVRNGQPLRPRLHPERVSSHDPSPIGLQRGGDHGRHKHLRATRLLAAASPHPPVPSDQRLHQAFGAVPLRQLVTED